MAVELTSSNKSSAYNNLTSKGLKNALAYRKVRDFISNLFYYVLIECGGLSGTEQGKPFGLKDAGDSTLPALFSLKTPATNGKYSEMDLCPSA